MSKSKRLITLFDNSESLSGGSKLVYFGHWASKDILVPMNIFAFESPKTKKRQFSKVPTMTDLRFFGAMPHFGLTLNDDGTFKVD